MTTSTIATSIVVALLVASGPASAAPKACGERQQILQQLAQQWQEQPAAVALSADGSLLEVTVAPDGGWTMLATKPNEPTCIVAAGEAWQTVLLGEAS